MWDSEQRRRLAFERRLLERKMPQFRFYDLTGNTYIAGHARTNSGRSYGVRVELPPDYPFDEPSLFITSPRRLPTDCGGSVNDEGTSHAFHTHDNNGGYVRICHTGSWDASRTCIQVLTKVHLWLEAYEGHLRTGRDLANFLC